MYIILIDEYTRVYFKVEIMKLNVFYIIVSNKCRINSYNEIKGGKIICLEDIENVIV